MLSTRSFACYDDFVHLINSGSRKTIEAFLLTVSDPKAYLNGRVIYNQVYDAPLFQEPAHWNHDNTVLDLFLENGVDINCRNSNGETALHNAAQFGNLSKVKYLIEHGANLSALYRGMTPLTLAAYAYYRDNKECSAGKVLKYLATLKAPGVLPPDRPEAAQIYKLHYPTRVGRAAVGTLFSKAKDLPQEIGEEVIGKFLGDGRSQAVIPVAKTTAIAAEEEKKEEARLQLKARW